MSDEQQEDSTDNIVIDASIQEGIRNTNEIKKALISTKLESNEATELIRKQYIDWNIISLEKEPFEESFIRDETEIFWRSENIFYFGQKL